MSGKGESSRRHCKMNVFGRYYFHRIADAGTDVLDFKVGIVVLDYLLERNPLSNDLKHINNWNPRARYAGFAKMNLRVYFYPFFHNSSSPDAA